MSFRSTHLVIACVRKSRRSHRPQSNLVYNAIVPFAFRSVGIRTFCNKSAPFRHCSRSCGSEVHRRNSTRTRPSGCSSVRRVGWPLPPVLLPVLCGVLLAVVSQRIWSWTPHQELNICDFTPRHDLLVGWFCKKHSPASNSIFFFAA